MLKNKMIGKKIRNIFILLMVLIIMIGAYHNIRNSKAENVIQIELEVADKSEILSAQTITVDATETSDGRYLLNLPISVNKNIVTKYYTSSGEEILVDAENGIATMELTDTEVANKKVKVQTDYDTKEVPVNGTSTTVGETFETKLFYKKELTNEINAEGQVENVTEMETRSETVNQDVVVIGYMPEDVKFEVKEIDLATLTDVKVPDEKQTMKKAYEFSIYQEVEKTTKAENENTDTIDEVTVEETEKERIEYNPSFYGEKITVKTKYEESNVIATVYSLDENNQLTKVESTTVENKTEETTTEEIDFETEKVDQPIKYIIATEEKTDSAIDQEEPTTSDDNINTPDADTNNDDIDDITNDETAENEDGTAKNEVKNSEWKVLDSNAEIVDGTTTIKVQGPEDILTEEWIKVFVNGENVENGITKEISEKNKTSDGVQYTITVTGMPTDANQVKIGLLKPKSVRAQENQTAGIQTFAMEENVEADVEEADDTINTLEDAESDDSGIMLLATTYNTLRSTASETDVTSAFLGNAVIPRQNVQKVVFTNDTSNLPIRRYSGVNNTWNGHNGSVTTWTDMAGIQNGTINGTATWGENYLELNGTNNWVNLGKVDMSSNKISLDASISMVKKQSGEVDVISNYQYGGAGIYLKDGVPVFSVYVKEKGDYVIVEGTSALKVNNRTRIVGTYNGNYARLYVDGTLVNKVKYTGTIKAPGNNTVMAIGANPNGNTADSCFANIKVFYAEVFNDRVLNENDISEIGDKATKHALEKAWDVSAQQDGSIRAWIQKLGEAPFTVTIASSSTIYANQDSSWLFGNIGYSTICTATDTLTNLNLLNVSNVTNMYAMFVRCGYRSMTSLDLGSFNTGNVTYMHSMFQETGYCAMTSFSLGSSFNTGNVTNMAYMFYQTGRMRMPSLNLGSNFNTSSATDMNNMFSYCGTDVMTSLNLGSNFNTGKVTNMRGMFQRCGYFSMTSLNIGSLFDTSQVTDMSYMFEGTGYTNMTSLTLGSRFDTRNVTNMEYMFQYCGSNKLESLSLGSNFYTSSVTNMNYMFYYCGSVAMSYLDLGPAFTKIADSNDWDFGNCGKSGAVIYVPESIYKTRTSFKKSSGDTSTAEEAITVSSGRTVSIKYKPEWTVTGTSINTTNKSITINLSGAANSNYSSTVSSNLSTSHITVWIDGTELTGVSKSVSSASGSAPLTQSVTISNFEESFKQSGKSYKEWSGNITLKIGGRERAVNTYGTRSLVDAYGNQSVSQIDTSGTWVNVTFTTATASANTSGRLFADVVSPSIIYEYSNTTIDYDNQKVTVVFDVTDKYFNTISLSASNITVTVGGVTATNASKTLTKVSDITATVDGVSAKVGEKYQLVLTNLDRGGGTEYSGIMTMAFPASFAKDKSGNGNVAKTITVGIDDPTTGDGHTTGVIVDVVRPAIVYEYSNTVINHTGQIVSVRFDIKDKYIKTISINASDITVKIAGEVPTNAQKTLTKLYNITETVDGTAGVKVGERYELVLTNLDQGKGMDYSGIMTIAFPAGIATDNSGNTSLAKTITVGIDDPTTGDGHASGVVVDVVKPVIEKVSLSTDIDAQSSTIVFNIKDKYLNSANTLAASSIKVYINGTESTSVTKTLSRVTANDVTQIVDGSTQVVSQQYSLNIKGFTTNVNQIKVQIPAEAVVDKNSNGNQATEFMIFNALRSTASETAETSPFLGNTSIKRQGIGCVSFENSIPELPVRSYTGVNNNWNGNNKSLTVWKDLAGMQDGQLNGGTWAANHLVLDGVDDWVNLGQVDMSSNKVTLDIEFYTSEIKSGEADLISNYEDGGAGLYLDSGIPVFSVYIKEKDDYVIAKASTALQQGGRHRVTGTYNGGYVCLYVDEVLVKRVRYTGTIKAPENSTVMAIGTNPKGNAAKNCFSHMRVYAARVYNRALTINEIQETNGNDIRAWDVSAQQDGSIRAWIYGSISDGNPVYIGSKYEIFGNKDSSYLFAFLGTSSACKATETISNIELLNVSSVTNMGWMFNSCGYNAMTSLDLGNNFDTSKVTEMYGMFYRCGYNAMKTLNLGSKFDTSNVNSDMQWMFASCGYTAMTSLDLGDKFDTSKVTGMHGMFHLCGYTAMTSLNLGGKFDTSKVTDMYGMFHSCGYTAMTSLNLGSNFNTSNVTNMGYMFHRCGYNAMTSLDLGGKFDTSKVTDMQWMFAYCGYTAMTSLNLESNFNTSNVTNMDSMFFSTGNNALKSLDLGNLFDTSKVTNMAAMFSYCGYTAMTSLKLGEKFNTANVTHMECMFLGTGYTAMTSLKLGNKFSTNSVEVMEAMFEGTGSKAMETLDLGPAFTRLLDDGEEVFWNTGKSGAVIYAPEAIYKDRTSFKLNSTDTSTASGTLTPGTGRTIEPKYRPEWKYVTTVASNQLNIILQGTTSYTGTTTANINNINENDITVWIDGTELTEINKTISSGALFGKGAIVIHLSNFEETILQSGKSYKEWSGNITLKIAGREEATSTYSKKVLVDEYGNQSMSAIDTTGTWIDIKFKDEATSSANETGKLFADTVSPTIIYEYTNTTIDHGNKKVTIVFNITDKYFKTSTLTASNITIKFEGSVATNASKTLTKVSDITETVDGTANTKVGEKYQLEVTNLDQGGGGDYSGIMTLEFAKSVATDNSGNGNAATTVTIGIDTPTTGDGHTSGVIVDVVSPVWKVASSNADTGVVKIRVYDKYLTKSSSKFELTTDKIKVIVNGVESTVITKTLTGPRNNGKSRI